MAAFIGLLQPIIELGKCIGGPIKRHFNYLFCFSNNIQTLREEAQKLKDAKDGLQIRVNTANNNIEEIYPAVLTWLETARQSNDIIDGIENDVPEVQNGCLNLISRYSLSRRAKKTAEALRDLHTNCKFDRISEAARPVAMASLDEMVPKEEFESRKEIEEDVMKTLRDRNLNIIGLCGMGGIGKTTIANRIMKRVKEEKLFDEVVMVVVGRQVEIPKLQQSIADQLNLSLRAGDPGSRATEIRTRLTEHTKKILLVIDDVWENLNLEELGIPSERCTVLLTSRHKNVLNIMETQRIFGVNILPKREAWLLFKKKNGDCEYGEDLHSIAEDVAKECNGLPVALVTVGGALRNKKTRQLWVDALSQLRSSKPDDLPRMLVDVYKPLRLSYDYLDSKRARHIFLLCSVFEEDFDIELETLTRYGVGLDIFEELGNFNAARNRTFSLIDQLKDHSLLLDGSDKYHVKIHDVVRDMAIYIAPEEQHRGFVINCDTTDWASQEKYFRDCYWISITNFSTKIKFPVQLECPGLRLLMMQGEYAYKEHYKLSLSDSFFDGMQEIRVLLMERIRIKSLLPMTKLLKNLKTLRLYGCDGLDTISVVGELLKLEILSCESCDSIMTLPIEIRRLDRLRLLEIINCQNLTRIVPGIISNLISLEELTLRRSFRMWEAKESNAKENAALAELESLTKLTNLVIEIDDVTLAAEEICLPSEIKRYKIAISRNRNPRLDDFSSMHIEMSEHMNVGNWIKTLVRGSEWLYIKGDGENQLVNLVECSLVKLVNTTTITTSVFPLLESLELHSLDKLEDIIPVDYCYTDHHSCFRSLKKIYISKCPRLQYLFPMRVAISCLEQLEHLKVHDCVAIENIFCDDHDKMEKDGKAFPKLNDVELRWLPSLKAQETLNKIVAPCNLKTLHLEQVKDDEISSVESLCSPFTNLEYMIISYFNGIKNLMSLAIARNLVQLKSLVVESCEMMSAVIVDDDDVQVMDQISLFPCLENLSMKSLPNLRSFCQRNHHNTLELPSLRELEFRDCPLVKNFSWGSLNVPKLKRATLNSRSIDIKDLNKAIQERWEC